MLFGLSIGLAVALVVFLRSPDLRLPANFSERSRAAAPVTGEAAADEPQAGEAATDNPDPGSRTGDAAPSPAAGPEEQATQEGTELEFYKLLRELEVTVPESSRREEIASRVYTIQAGSFREFAEADSRQARLALLGIESHVERAIVGNDIWHRVIIGPLGEPGEIERVLRQLREERIDALPPQPVTD